MTPKWLVGLNCLGENDTNPAAIVAAATAAGCDAKGFKYIPFEHDRSQKFPIDRGHDCVIVYGSIQLVRLVQRSTQWIPGAWCDWPNLRASVFMTQWGKYSIHKNFGFFPFGMFPSEHKRLFSMFGLKRAFRDDTDLFIKPDSNGKEFHGEIVNSSQYDQWWKYAQCYDPTPDLMCLVSEPTKIKQEWRLVMADRKYVTGSQYVELIDGNRSAESKAGCPAEVAAFAEEVAASTSWEPASIYCMDIADTVYNGLRLVEIGSINCAGLYDCDVTKIVEKANEIAIRDWTAVQ